MIISEPIILLIMRTALAYKPEDQDEVPVVPTEALESNIGVMRGELTELKTDFKEHRKEFTAAVVRLDHDIKAAVVRLDNDIKSAVAELRAEIRSMVAKAERELQIFAGRVDDQLREMRADHTRLGDKVDKHYETLNAKIDKNHAELTGEIAAAKEAVAAAKKEIAEVRETVNRTDSKMNALFWVIGILVGAATFLITVGQAFGWFH